ncbi:MAG: hypothetical protein A3G92_00610 [Deltaproteobacteria bacterium RIFCSPLOWO2_12_FULL_38_8]|nr:MAG: hypothetical protein A3G92_00610 [Deltaproteobacteria bacterium RIFCSPLOWO2_12_FULL_38_8]
MNVAHYLPLRAEKSPETKALYFLNSSWTFSELNLKSDTYAHFLKKQGIEKGHRIILMVRPGVEFVALTFALLKIGAISVLIDPGIGKQYLKHCIREAEPHGFIGIPKAHLLRWLWPSSFKTSLYNIVVGPKWFLGISTLPHSIKKTPFPMVETQDTDPAAIIFTTGSTGIPKGVIYEHGMFEAQIKILQKTYGIKEGEVDMPTFPLFVLFSVAMGTTSVIPDMDPTKPALCNPQTLVQTIQRHQVTYSFGSPALWNRITQYCIEHKIHLPSMTLILIAGAPVPSTVLERFQKIVSPEARVYTPYGATEALPVTSGEWGTSGYGTCVGKPLNELQVKIIRITDQSILTWDKGDNSLEINPGTIGEIVVKGPMVTKSYFNRPKETSLAKIKDPTDGSFWHRMGDVGYIDSQGRLWFCGRKAHRVQTYSQTLYTIPCEAIFNQHPEVFRSALVGVSKTPVIIIELKDKKNKSFEKISKISKMSKIKDELLILARRHPHTQDIQTILFHPSFPVDIRHNAKINREKLALWAKEKLS